MLQCEDEGVVDMADGSVKTVLGAAEAIVAVRWSMFVAAFLYYTGLTLLAIGVGELSDTFMAYGLPVAIYFLIVVARFGTLSHHVISRSLHAPSALT